MEVAWGRERLRIDVLREDVVRIKISRGGVFDETPTLAVVADGGADFEVDGTTLRTAAPRGGHRDPRRPPRRRHAGDRVDRALRHAQRRVLGAPPLPPGGRDLRARREDRAPQPHAAAPSRSGTPTSSTRTPRRRFGGDGDSIDFDPYYVSIPFFHHHTADGHGWRRRSSTTATAPPTTSPRPTSTRFRFEGGQYTEYVFAGPSLPAIVEAYTWLTGRAAPPPLWALGYHQCRWKAYSQADVEALGARHRELGIPCDALWLDIEYMDGYRVFTWNRELFPDAPGMLARLREQGFRVITIIDPGVKHEPGYAVFDSALERDVLCRTEGGDIYIGEVWPGDTAFPDFVTEDGRRWWGELNAAHVESGLAGIWNDMNEPATGEMAPERMRFDRGPDSHERWHNQYALLMAMGTRDGLLEAMPELRTFILSRAGFAGIQRYAANWMGDNQARWDHLWLSIPMANGFGLSGQPFVGADVGGFQGNSNAELFLRWMQYGALTPFCRNHSMLGDVDQYAWAWGEAVLTEARRAIELRYRLLPYIYSAFITATETGAPVQRPLVFDHQYDAAVRDIDDEYLFGPDLLVAPVHEPRTTARQVYLPAGDWYDWHTGERFGGPGSWWPQTPMDRIPLYARGGRGDPDVAVRRRPRPTTGRTRSSCTCSSPTTTARTRRSCRRTTGSRSTARCGGRASR